VSYRTDGPLSYIDSGKRRGFADRCAVHVALNVAQICLSFVLDLVVGVFRQIRGRRRGEGRGRLLFSDFTVRDFWQQAAIIAFIQQSKYETCMAVF